MPEKIAVFLDFQNVHFVGHNLFSRGVQPYRCVPNPARLADLIADRRRSSSTAVKINVYRGRPDSERQPTLTAANDAQADYWTRDRRVQVEVAYWTGGNILRFPGTNLPWHHALSRRDWAAVIEDWQNRV
jgi:hypothetical protein